MADLLTPKQDARFWAKADIPAGLKVCWIWKGFINKDGYGCFAYRGNTERAHRIAYAVGNDLSTLPPPGAAVLHTCENRACVRPEHLYLDTEKAILPRRRPTKPKPARFRSYAELTPQDISTIRNARNRGEKYADLAKRLQIAIYAIIRAEKAP